jgi:hypothetical protein
MSELKDDLKSGGDELKNRAAAGAEKAKRAVEGDEMPVGDRIASHVNEAVHNVKAEFDKGEREARHGADEPK